MIKERKKKLRTDGHAISFPSQKSQTHQKCSDMHRFAPQNPTLLENRIYHDAHVRLFLSALFFFAFSLLLSLPSSYTLLSPLFQVCLCVCVMTNDMQRNKENGG
jgi:hypothetical protein